MSWLARGVYTWLLDNAEDFFNKFPNMLEFIQQVRGVSLYHWVSQHLNIRSKLGLEAAYIYRAAMGVSTNLSQVAIAITVCDCYAIASCSRNRKCRITFPCMCSL